MRSTTTLLGLDDLEVDSYSITEMRQSPFFIQPVTNIDMLSITDTGTHYILNLFSSGDCKDR